MSSALDLVRAAAEPAPSTRTPSQAFDALCAELRNRVIRIQHGQYKVQVFLIQFPSIQVRSTAWENPDHSVVTGLRISRSGRGTYPKLSAVANDALAEYIPGDIHRGVSTWQDLLRNAVNLSIRYAEKEHRNLVRMQKLNARLNRPTAATESLLHDDLHRSTPSDSLRKRLSRLGNGRVFTYKGHRFQIQTYGNDDSCVVFPRPPFPNANNAENVQWILYQDHYAPGPEKDRWLKDKGPLSAVPRHTFLQPKVDTGRGHAASSVLNERQHWIEEAELKTDRDLVLALLKNSEPLLRGHGFRIKPGAATAAAEPLLHNDLHREVNRAAYDITTRTRNDWRGRRFLELSLVDFPRSSNTWIYRVYTDDGHGKHRFTLYQIRRVGAGKELVGHTLNRDRPLRSFAELLNAAVEYCVNSTDKARGVTAAAEPQPPQEPAPVDLLKMAKLPEKTFHVKGLEIKARSSEYNSKPVWSFVLEGREERKPRTFILRSDYHQRGTRYELILGDPGSREQGVDCWEIQDPRVRTPRQLLQVTVEAIVKLELSWLSVLPPDHPHRRGVTAATEHTDLNDMSLGQMFMYLYRKSKSKPADVKMDGHRCHIRFNDVYSAWVCLDDSDMKTVLFSVDNLHHRVRGLEPVLRMHLNGSNIQELLWQSELPRNPQALMQRMVAESVKFLETRGATAAAEPVVERHSEDTSAYKAILLVVERKPKFTVAGTSVHVEDAHVNSNLAWVLLVLTQGSDTYRIRMRAMTYDTRISVEFDWKPDRTYSHIYYIPESKLKPDNTAVTLTELVRVCGLHHGAVSEIPHLDQDAVEICAESIAETILDDIGDRESQKYDEDNDEPKLSAKWSHTDLDPASKAMLLKVARSFYVRIANSLAAFVAEHGSKCAPAPKDIGYYIAQEFISSSLGFEDMNAPKHLNNSEAWEALMGEMTDATQAVTRGLQFVTIKHESGKLHIKTYGGAIATAAAEPKPRFDVTELDDVVQELCRRCHGKPIGDDEFDIGPFHEDIGTMTVRVFRARNEENRNPKHFSVGVYLFNEQLDLEPEIRIQDRGDVTAAMQELLRIHNAVRALAKAAPDPERFRAAVIRYGQELERGHGEYGQDPSNNWAVELAGFWRRLRRA